MTHSKKKKNERLTKRNVWRKLEKEKENKPFYTYISISIYSVLKKHLDVSTSLLIIFGRERITCPDQSLNNASVLKPLDSMTYEFVLTQSSTASEQICIIKLTWHVFTITEVKSNTVVLTSWEMSMLRFEPLSDDRKYLMLALICTKSCHYIGIPTNVYIGIHMFTYRYQGFSNLIAVIAISITIFSLSYVVFSLSVSPREWRREFHWVAGS